MALLTITVLSFLFIIIFIYLFIQCSILLREGLKAYTRNIYKQCTQVFIIITNNNTCNEHSIRVSTINREYLNENILNLFNLFHHDDMIICYLMIKISLVFIRSINSL